jgi:hypothetical protein
MPVDNMDQVVERAFEPLVLPRESNEPLPIRPLQQDRAADEQQPTEISDTSNLLITPEQRTGDYFPRAHAEHEDPHPQK